MTHSSYCKFRVGDWLVESDLNRMIRADRIVQFEPKVMDVLTFLALHAGGVCPKDTIIKAVWPGVGTVHSKPSCCLLIPPGSDAMSICGFARCLVPASFLMYC